jgi:hypothetical protein
MRAFADSFYFIALLNANDPAHERVVRYSKEQQRELVTGLSEALTGDRHFAQAGFMAMFAD